MTHLSDMVAAVAMGILSKGVHKGYEIGKTIGK
jgi:hypothetical protein